MRSEYTLKLRDGTEVALGRRTLVAGVLNVTPDSFSDGGLNLDPARAIERALEIVAEGADILEIGGESTRPGSDGVSAKEELARVLPVLEGLSGRLRIPIAIDTTKSEIARIALDLGASIINDVSALRFDSEMANLAARESAVLVLMHMRGIPSVMQNLEPSADIFAEIESDLGQAIDAATSAGVARDKLIIDPGIGFGKTMEQNLDILKHLDRIESIGLPIMIGTSRKAFIGRLTGHPEGDRVFGTAASVVVAILHGAHMVRVHDVKEMVDVARIADALA
jgi:dihydropteroate synthase